jgi:hypothetical protein
MSMSGVVGAAFRAGRRHLWRVLAVAIAVSLLTAVIEIVVDHFVDPGNVTLSLSAEISAAGVSLLGTLFLSGVLTRLVGESEHGGAHQSLAQVARSLPWGRLVLADVAVVLLTVAGLLLLVIPGLIIVNLLAVTGPVIEIEDRRVRAALRRSAHLVRRRFWAVALLATLPVILASQIESLIPDPENAGEILEVLAIRGIGEALVEAAIGLVLVELCYRLIALDAAAARAARAVAAGPALARQRGTS